MFYRQIIVVICLQLPLQLCQRPVEAPRLVLDKTNAEYAKSPKHPLSNLLCDAITAMVFTTPIVTTQKSSANK